MKLNKIAKTSDFKEKNKMKVNLGEKEILIVKLNDDYFAIDNKCTHMGGSLYEGEIKGDVIVCPKHKAEFNIRTGKGEKDGKILFLKAKIKDLNSYYIKIENEEILVGIDE